MAGERQTEPHQAGPFGVPAAGDFHCGRCGTLLDGGTDEPVAARELRAELANQVVEIVALIRSYANVHMTRALADLIEHKYIHGEERRA